MNLDLAYRLEGRKAVHSLCKGRTLNISSSGALFEADAQAPAGTPIYLAFDWPVAMNDQCALKLVVDGHVVRCDGASLAVRFDRYEFRTALRREHTPQT